VAVARRLAVICGESAIAVANQPLTSSHFLNSLLAKSVLSEGKRDYSCKYSNRSGGLELERTLYAALSQKPVVQRDRFETEN
jgi:hypothetical protein